jgi:hypothetical protein
MINKIKETLSQVFFSPEASGTWEEKIECAIDDVTVKCEDLEAPIQECGPGHLTQGYGFFGYTGVPAPRVLEDDEWFGPAPVSDLNQDHVAQEAEIKQQEQENRQYWTNEPEDIHQVMYEMATKSGATTVQLDPIGGSENFQGGSENVHR